MNVLIACTTYAKSRAKLRALLTRANIDPDASYDARKVPALARAILSDPETMRGRPVDFTGSNLDVLCSVAVLPSGKIRPNLGSSLKILKNIGDYLETKVVYMSPHIESGWNMCPWATGYTRVDGVLTVTPGKGCAGNCLTGSGQMVTNPALVSRLLKTALYQMFRPVFVELVSMEVAKLSRRVEKLNRTTDKTWTAGVRLNGTSDVMWEHDAPELFTRHPDVVWYDYTKGMLAARRRALSIPNYHLTFSMADVTDARQWQRSREWQAQGVNVAVVVRNRAQAERLLDVGYWMGRPVIDGDASDARPYDAPMGGWVLLYAKGKHDASDPFIVDLDNLPATITTAHAA